MKNEQRKNILIGIFVISTIVLGIFSVYIGNSLKNNEAELQEIKAKLESNNNVSNDNNIKNDVTVSQNPKEEIVEEEKNIKTKIDLKKCLNFAEGEVFETASEFIVETPSFKVEKISDHVDLGFNKENMKNKVFFTNIKQNTNLKFQVKYELKGFESEIKKILTLHTGGIAKDYSYAVIFLMEDGTITYFDTKDAYEKDSFIVKNNFNELKEIVDIQPLVGMEENENGGYWAPYNAIAAVKKDGSYYDLKKFL